MIIETCATILTDLLMASPTATRRGRRAKAEAEAAQGNGTKLKRPRYTIDVDSNDDAIDINKRVRIEAKGPVLEKKSRLKRPSVGKGRLSIASSTPPLKEPMRRTESLKHQDASIPVNERPIHAQKAINGIKHELERLQPAPIDTKDDKRKLRSQEGVKFKSELSQYFPEYDVVIGNEEEVRRKFALRKI
jgi:hypothetical protein